MFTQSAVSETERREALEAVVNSQTFARSAQLRAFLRYICERQIAGHPEELTEYQIAVNVLGRAKDYNLADDSAVRNRAYELRQRLEKFYLLEGLDSEVRIDVPRGSYVPCFTRRQRLAKPVEAPEEEAVDKRLPRPQKPKPGVWMTVATAALAALGGLAAGLFIEHPRPASVLKEAWGPLADPRDELLISVATNLHMTVRPHIPAHPLRFPAPKELQDVYGPNRPLSPDTPLFMEPAQLSVPFAEMIATAALSNMRMAFGGGYQILPEAEAPVAALRGRNAILIGTGTNSEAANVLLRNLPWTIDYAPKDQIAVIDQRKPAGQNQLFVAQPNGLPVSGEQYGLLSVITAPGVSGSLKRTTVISGIGSAAVQSVVEFLCSATHMREMKKRFQDAGLPGFPAVYQVVVRCRTAGLRPISYEYAAHVVVSR